MQGSPKDGEGQALALTTPFLSHPAAAGLLCLLLGVAVVSLHYAQPRALRIFLNQSVKDCGSHVRGRSPLTLNNELWEQLGASDLIISTNL